MFSKAAAYLAGVKGCVLSIEADLDVVRLLQRTCRRASVEDAPMTVLPVAVSNSVGFVRFAIAVRSRSSNFIEGYGQSQTGGVVEVRTMPCYSLDSLLSYFNPPAVLKIDVEGAELDVLSGAEQLFTFIRPVIYCEVADEVSDKVTEFFSMHNYKIWDGKEFGIIDVGEIERCTPNTVAIPAEKIMYYLN